MKENGINAQHALRTVFGNQVGNNADVMEDMKKLMENVFQLVHLVKLELIKNVLNLLYPLKYQQELVNLPLQEYQANKLHKLDSQQRQDNLHKLKPNLNNLIIVHLIVAMKLGEMSAFVGVDIKRTVKDIV